MQVVVAVVLFGGNKRRVKNVFQVGRYFLPKPTKYQECFLSLTPQKPLAKKIEEMFETTVVARNMVELVFIHFFFPKGKATHLKNLNQIPGLKQCHILLSLTNVDRLLTDCEKWQLYQQQ